MIGKLLVAHPSLLGDPSFGRGVVLMTSHNNDGSMGFIVNQPTHYTLNDLLPEFGFEAPVYQGGPVETDRLFYLHSCENLSGAQALGNNLYWGGDLDELKKALDKAQLAPNEVRFFLGYSGWGKGQLKAEYHEKSWLLLKNNYNIFSNVHELWGTIMRDVGGEIALYATAPKHPGLN